MKTLTKDFKAQVKIISRMGIVLSNLKSQNFFLFFEPMFRSKYYLIWIQIWILKMKIMNFLSSSGSFCKLEMVKFFLSLYIKMNPQMGWNLQLFKLFKYCVRNYDEFALFLIDF